MTEPSPAPQQTPTAAPRAPGLVETMESSLQALVDHSVFRRAAGRPAPSFGVSIGFALAAGSASVAVNLAHALVSNPALLQTFSPAVLAAAGLAALCLYTSALLLLSVMLYGMGKTLGGTGDFERGLQAASMLSVLGPIQMLCNWFPVAWVLPALLAGWAAAGALEGLFGARRGPARTLCAILAAAVVGLQFLGRTVAERARDAYAAAQMMTNAPGAGVGLMEAPPALPQQAPDSASSAMTPVSPSSPPPISSLDLLRGNPEPDAAGPVAAGPPPGPGAPPQVSPGTSPDSLTETADKMQANAAAMLAALSPMLDMLSMNKNLTPAQKASMKEAKALMSDLRDQLSSKTPMDNATFARKMARYQQLMSGAMAGGLTPSAGAPAPAPGAKGPAKTAEPTEGR
jgi:hypothetical protein